jgi:eukaryotic-like serine/threonine-protein kinase
MEVRPQAYLLTVVAKGNDIYLYRDKRCVAQIQDDTAASGKIGLMAISYRRYTHVQFRNVQVWDLKETVPTSF